MAEEKPTTLLSEEQIKRMSQKKWNTDLIDTQGREFAEERSEESKSKSLRNLRPIAAKPTEESVAEELAPELEDLAYLSAIAVLNEDEKKFFKRKWEKYRQDYNTQTSVEEGFIISYIMEEITENRLRAKYFEKKDPSINLDEQLKKCAERKDRAYAKLAAFKKEKWGDVEEAKSLAQLILEADKRALLYEQKEPEYLEEERILLDKNTKQFEVDLLEAEQGYMDQEIIERVEPTKADVPPPVMEPSKQEFGIFNYISLANRQPVKK